MWRDEGDKKKKKWMSNMHDTSHISHPGSVPAPVGAVGVEGDRPSNDDLDDVSDLKSHATT